MATYVRPAVPDRVFRDEHGAVIPYGNRWDGGSPPEDTYSVITHAERFEPVTTVAEALIAHLRATYDVDVVEGADVLADVEIPLRDVRTAVRLAPRLATAAPLTFAVTDDPGVLVHAGLLHEAPFPGCRCDACDETWQTEADDLEVLVLAVAAGRFGERVTGVVRPWVHHAFADERGTVASGRELAHRVPRGRLRAARRALRRFGGGPWHAWPLRRAGST